MISVVYDLLSRINLVGISSKLVNESEEDRGDKR